MVEKVYGKQKVYVIDQVCMCLNTNKLYIMYVCVCLNMNELCIMYMYVCVCS